VKAKKDLFFNQIKEGKSAVLVGPLLKNSEVEFIPKSPLLLVDGGLDMALKHRLLGDRSYFSVGDGDSSTASLDEIIPIEKDYSDLAYALHLLPNSVQKVELFGFLGGRSDHELCNFGEVFHYLKKKNIPSLVKIGLEVIALSAGDWKFTKDGSFSLISFQKLEVRLTGEASYLLRDWTTIEAFSSHGLSNEGLGDINLQIKSPVFLYGDGITVKEE
jgi:thiamine pyrophosphokinase